jgi:hypothetical protein
MSGDMQFLVNRVWSDVTKTGNAVARYFSQFLVFFNNHPEFDIISYGTGKSETGTTVPTSWVTWAESDGSGALPFGDNSWFVVQAQKASAALDGDGSRPWEAKFQYTSSTAFDDCNEADTEYGAGTEGTTHKMYTRPSPDGGWVGEGTQDFVSVDAGDNIETVDATTDTSENNFGLHIIGDDDTVIWVAQYLLAATPLPLYSRQRFGYLGETIRRGTGITKPELAIIGSAFSGTTGYLLKKDYNFPIANVFNSPRQGTDVPSFSLTSIPTEVVTKHRFWAGFEDTGANEDMMFNTNPDPWTDETEHLGIIARQDSDRHNSVFGQLRLIEASAEYITEGNLIGDGTRLSVGYDTAVHGGLCVPWPGSGTSPVF